MYPVFLVTGAQRAGTTLLQTLVANALDAPVLPEAHFLRDLLAAHAAADRSWAKAEAYFGRRDLLDSQFRDIVSLHLDSLMKLHGHPERLVLKDPGFLNTLPSLRRVLPEVPLAVILRDPRDIAASFIAIGHRQAKGGNARSKYARRDLLHVLRKLSASHAPLLDDDGGPAALGCHAALVRYEELTTDPIAGLQTLGHSLDQPLVAPDLDGLVWSDRASRHQETWITRLEEGPPSDAHVGRFRELLTAEEIRRVEEDQAAFMSAYGYGPELAVVRQPDVEGPAAGAPDMGAADESHGLPVDPPLGAVG